MYLCILKVTLVMARHCHNGTGSIACKYEIADEKTGKVNKGHYHNFVVSLSEPYAQTEKARIGFMGQEANIYKVKAENIASVFGVQQGEFNPTAYADWFLQPVEVLYDKRGNLKSIKRINTSPTVTKIES